MDIKPIDFLLAKQAVDYFVKVDNLDLPEEHYKFHVYNLAQLMSMTTGFSESMIEHLSKRDDFVENMTAFGDEFWAMMESINEQRSDS